MILRFSIISDKFRNPERLTASENMKPFISSYTIQSHIFLINIKLSNMSKSSIKSSRAFSFDCNEEAVILNLKLQVLSGQPTPHQALMITTKTTEYIGANKWG